MRVGSRQSDLRVVAKRAAFGWLGEMLGHPATIPMSAWYVMILCQFATSSVDVLRQASCNSPLIGRFPIHNQGGLPEALQLKYRISLQAVHRWRDFGVRRFRDVGEILSLHPYRDCY